jgi:Family of unknown function (DUF6644)
MFLQNAIADALNNTEWAFPLAECFHIAGFAVSVGTIALVDFRMLGLALRKETAARLVGYTEPWTLISLIIVLFSGAVLFMSQIDIYLANSVFPWKMVCLVVAIVFNFTIHRKVAMSTTASPALSKLVGAISLVLWVGTVFGGLFIAFV